MLEFISDFTKKIVRGKEEFTSSIIDDHLPLIASGAAVLFALLIALLACCFIRRRNQKKNGELKLILVRFSQPQLA